MRQLAAMVLSVPVLVLVYTGTLLRRSAVIRTVIAVGVATAIAVGGPWSGGTTPTTARPPTIPVPLTTAAFQALATNGGLDSRVTIEFTTPMDPASVAASLAIDPPTAVDLTWGDSFHRLMVQPIVGWRPDTLHAITVMPGALAQTGRPLATPVRETFLTRPTTAGSIAATERFGDRVGVESAFDIQFDRPVDTASVMTGLLVDPEVPGLLLIGPAVDGTPRFTFVPREPLRPGASYRIAVTGVRDDEGAPVDPLALTVRTATAPTVVRFRPRDGTTEIDRDAAVSVRFTESMDRATTRMAFRVTIDDVRVEGRTSFAEDDMVIVFVPEAAFPYGTTVVASVDGSAQSVTGVDLAEPADGVFKTVRKPAPKPAPVAARAPTSGGGSGGGSVGSGSWRAVEGYYLDLMNCTRTGGIVSSSGKCTSPGGRNVAPLALDAGISNKVSRPYAKLLATRNACSHFIGGNPGDRLKRAGYTNYVWAENLGCRSGGAMSSVLGSHLYFQAEKSYNGGHYVNLMNAKYSRAGIGVWVASGRVRLVVNFYHP